MVAVVEEGYRTGTNGAGGSGGGASGAIGQNGTDELGGGGGGAYLCDDGCFTLFGQGGSGIVVLRYSMVPNASFTVSNTTGMTPVIVQFNDTSTNIPTTWQWNATNVTGNNTAFTFSTEQNPNYTFGVGNFSIKLYVTNGGGTNLSTQNTWINVSPSAPTANFTSNVTVATIYPMVVQFNDTSTVNPTVWNWSFGDGRWFNTTDSLLRNTTYTYAVANKYNVTLLVNNTVGDNTTIKYDYINLTSDNDDNLTSWLHMNGTNASTTFSDEKGLAWATSGNAQISTLSYKYGGASGRFDGTGDYISTPNSSAISFGTGNFTIEFWMNVTTVAGANEHVFSKTTNTRSRGWGMDRTDSVAGDSGWDFWMGNDSAGQVFFNAPIENKTWVHIAIERRAGTIYLYVNGNLTNSSAGFNANYDTVDPLWIGRQGTNYYDGYVDEFRISKVARWTSNFTPPFNEYRGTLETIYPDVNPDSTFRYKTDPTGSAYIDNVTAVRNRSVQIQNITNTSYVVGAAYFQPLYGYVKSVQLNLSYYPTGMTLVSSSIDNTNGIVEFNISKPTGFSPGTDRASIIDYTIAYVNYTDGSENVSEYFAYGYLINGSTSKVYPIHNFLGTPVTYGDWNFTADFTANNTTILKGETVNFNSTFNGSYPNRWNWSFGDGTFADGENSSINHTYTTLGLHTVELTEYLWQNSSVNNTKTRVGYIMVYDPTTANITSNVTAGLAPLAVEFNASTSLNATWWNWSFGDGTYDNYTNVIIDHVYSVGGRNYTVSLTTSFDGYGANTTTGYNITVYNQTISGFTANVTYGNQNQGVDFNVTTVNDNATWWNWSFGDGDWQNGTEQNATHTFGIPRKLDNYRNCK